MFESRRPDHFSEPAMFVFLHGETEWNRAGRFQGRADSPLTAQGRAQAVAIGEILSCRKPSTGFRLVTSPLGRARTTAEIVAAALGIDAIAEDDRLAEIDIGRCEGLTRAEATIRFPAECGAIHRHEWPFHAPGGEGFAAITARVAAWLGEQSDHEDLLVCTHGIASRILRGLYTGSTRTELVSAEIARGVVFHFAGGAVTRIPAADCIVR